MSNSRVQNTKRNLFSGFVNILVSAILPFINRTIIIYVLGSEFAGLSGLFVSILQVLSLAEFGFSTVIVYYLYEPIIQKDTEAINQILAWMRTVYYVVGCAIICGGLIATPFLTRFIHGSYPEGINIYVLFLIYLFNSGVSYFLFAYKEVMLIADQRKDIISNINSCVKIVVNVLQFLAILIFKNYYLYAIVLILGSICTNLLVNRVVANRYPYLRRIKKNMKLSRSIKKDLIGLLFNRLSNVSRNAFDTLIISSTIGLVATSIYGNYYTIYSAALGVAFVICSSMQASVGNSIAVRSEEDNYNNLLDFSLLYSWFIGWCVAAMAGLFQPFMKLWVGEELMLSETNMMLFVIYFYFINMNQIRNLYIMGNAFWWKLKWAYLLEAIGNLILNIVLGRFWGVTGVLIATILTIFFCNYLMCNSVLFKSYFKNKSIIQFYRQQFYYLFVATIVTAITYMLCRMFDDIFIRAMICFIVPPILFFALYLPCSRFKSSVSIVKRIVKSH